MSTAGLFSLLTGSSAKNLPSSQIGRTQA
ncbi:hypothetical protein CCACVL1_17871 [Corchorus capsularis]|uniref:Uncharacterized protein n=1 Tax=Corchorus capsularis TaxID=210143 RepID=A0A1R3HPC3_COCAP|nr:hypothetical protein CCACVL1_17871 [Corchorus capsularis]